MIASHSNAKTAIFVPSRPARNLSGEPRVLNGKIARASLFWILQCAGWATFGAVMFAWGLQYWDFQDALANKAILILVGFAFTLLGRHLYRLARLHAIPHAASIFLIVAFSFAGATLWIEAENVLFHMYYSRQITFQPTAIPMGTLLYYGFVLLVWSLLYFGVNGWFELENQRGRAARAESLAHTARLQALQSQLEPHFLFNTLNAISTLVTEGNNSAATRMISCLSDFLRQTLDSAARPEISIAEELEFVKRYLEIQQVRFGERLKVTINASSEAMAGLVPTLLLQPLVENAVKHGVLPRELGGSVTLNISKQDDLLHISITDDGPGIAVAAAPVRGVGLSITATRLAELYGEKSRFSLGVPGNGGVVATIEIPFRTAQIPRVSAPEENE